MAGPHHATSEDEERGTMTCPGAKMWVPALLARGKRAGHVAAGRLLAGGIAAALIVLGAPAVSHAQAPKTAAQPTAAAPAARALPGNILVADRGSGRILIIGPDKQILWSMDFHSTGPTGVHSRWPDDAFITPDHRHIIVNEEDNQVVDIIDIATKRIIWSYGHTGVTGKAPGYFNTPDDAIQMPDGNIVVADIANQRVVIIDPQSKRIVRQYGVTGQRRHDPPRFFNAPDGAYPTPDGGLLVTEIGWAHNSFGYLDKLSADGKLVYSIKTNLRYPSDGVEISGGRVLVVDYTKPSSVEIYSPQGKVLWRYHVPAGPGELNHPSNALELPNGNILVCDDWNDRVIVIDPKSKAIIWQYGHQGVPGRTAGYLNIPDEVFFIPPEWDLPLH
jgi:DNA-binding beta-propeller fold protein YncE